MTIQTAFQEWQNTSNASEAAPGTPGYTFNTWSPGGEGYPYASWRSVYGRMFDNGMPPLRTEEIRIGPRQIALFQGEERAQEVTVLFQQEIDELTRGVCSFSPPSNTTDNQHQVMRSLQVTMLFNNHNYGLFFLGTFRFEMKNSGQVRPYYSFRPFRLDPAWGSWIQEISLSNFKAHFRLRSYLSLVNYILVFIRTFNELKAASKVLKDTGSLRPYFGGVFTLLELFNLTCNYVGLLFRIYEQFQPQRTELETLLLENRPQDVLETHVDMIVVIHGIMLTARALSVISAMLLLFKYLELAPKRFLSSFYLTGTTLGRAGRDLQVVMLLFLVVICAFSVIASEMFGSELEFFSSVPQAFFTLCVCVAGSGFIYRPLNEHFPYLGPAFFVIFTLTHLLVITPLFLATLNDAYAVRDEQMRQAAERRAEKERRRLEEREARLKMLKK